MGWKDKSTVCKRCHKEFAFIRSYSNLRYHLNAKHIAASMSTDANNIITFLPWETNKDHFDFNQSTEYNRAEPPTQILICD